MACCSMLETIGSILTVYVGLKVALGVWDLINVYFLGSCPNLKKYGNWAVVTGATDGIGLAFSEQLAKKGQNIVLISRTQEKLDKVANDLKEKFNVETKTIAVDFSQGDIWETVAEGLKDLKIGVLINNVGISYQFPEYFLGVDHLPEMIKKMVALNVTAAVKMTELVLPDMVKRKSGIILNIASAAALKPTPLLALYSASKQFVDCFSKTLHAEYSDQGIIVQSVMPFYVTTKLSKIRRSSFFVPTPTTYAASTLKTIGKTTRSYGCFAHALQATIFGLVPESIYLKIAGNMNKSIRKVAHKKMKKYAESKKE